MADKHTAYIDAFSGSSEDTYLTLRIICPECGTEWAWSRDNNNNLNRLESMVKSHNSISPEHLEKK